MSDLLQAVSGRGGQGSKRLRDLGDASHAEVVALPQLKARTVAANEVFNAEEFGDVEFQFEGSGTVTVSRSMDGALGYIPAPVSGRASNGTLVGETVNAVSAGWYAVDGNCFLKFSGAVTVRGRL